MTTPILHHYDLSPYSEKIRLIFGFKQIPWQSVQTSMVMPKPGLTELTGGYRKAPVLQIGADIYCDSRCIARALERLTPQPTLFPAGLSASEAAMSVMADSVFLSIVVLILGIGDVFPPEFIADRQKLIPGGFKVEEAQAAIPAKRGQIYETLGNLEAQLSDGRGYLLGDTVSLADFSVHQLTWFLAAVPATATLLTGLPKLNAWKARMESFGHFENEEISAEQAIEIAAAASPCPGAGVDADDRSGWKVGDRMLVAAEDYGREPIEGELVTANRNEIAIRRRSQQAGELVVHFPRQGFFAMKTG